MTMEDRLGETLRRTLPRVGPDVRGQLEALIEPQSLAIIAAVLVAWAVSHAFGVGEAIDIILAVIGVAAVGLSVFAGLDHLKDFALGVYNARTEADLDRAAEHLAQAIAIFGIQAVLAFLFRGRVRTARQGAGPAPPRTPGIRYRPTVTNDPSLPAGEGATSFWGDMFLSTKGSAADQALVRLHEQVHRFLAPKLYVLRNFRVESRVGSYFGSSLWRYVEEALAETIAQVGINGFRQFFTGLRFPVRNGYCYLRRGGGFDPAMAGRGIVPEGAALVATGTAAGMAFQLWFKATVPAHRAPQAPGPTR